VIDLYLSQLAAPASVGRGLQEVPSQEVREPIDLRIGLMNDGGKLWMTLGSVAVSLAALAEMGCLSRELQYW